MSLQGNTIQNGDFKMINIINMSCLDTKDRINWFIIPRHSYQTNLILSFYTLVFIHQIKQIWA